jgi:hypothetical protein
MVCKVREPGYTTVKSQLWNTPTDSKSPVTEDSETKNRVRPRRCGVTRMVMPSKPRKGLKERPMNSGIIRNALTTTLALELEYRESSVFRQSGTESERPLEFQHPGRLIEDEFTCLLSVI